MNNRTRLVSLVAAAARRAGLGDPEPLGRERRDLAVGVREQRLRVVGQPIEQGRLQPFARGHLRQGRPSLSRTGARSGIRGRGVFFWRTFPCSCPFPTLSPRTRWPLDETGRNSVAPCNAPRAIACSSVILPYSSRMTGRIIGRRSILRLKKRRRVLRTSTRSSSQLLQRAPSHASAQAATMTSV